MNRSIYIKFTKANINYRGNNFYLCRSNDTYYGLFVPTNTYSVYLIDCIRGIYNPVSFSGLLINKKKDRMKLCIFKFLSPLKHFIEEGNIIYKGQANNTYIAYLIPIEKEEDIMELLIDL